MKLIFKKDDLLNGINIVLKAVSSKTTMPILECILIDASSDKIKLTANDMELRRLRKESLMREERLHWMQNFFRKLSENFPEEMRL